MEKRYIIGIDQSTQGTKALLFDGEGHLLRRTDLPHRQIAVSYTHLTLPTNSRV